MTASPAPSPREQYENQHRQWLSPCAVGEDVCGGRKHAEEPHEYRTCFQRDRDRIVHCSAFRRLDFKTQVFVPHEHDHYRTRLTHTLEVAQIARDLGRALRLNEDLMEAASLAHDLGHPPFGHGGEAVLDTAMAKHGGFEHNRQSLRIVDYLEHPYPQFRGLNLTRVVRECLAKHRTRYDAPVCEEFDASLEAPLEGQLVDMADEIAYTAADLDDALAAGCIKTEQLAPLALWQAAAETAQAKTPSAGAVHKRIRAVKAMLSALADDLIFTTAGNIKSRRLGSVDDVRRAGRRAACLSAPSAAGLAEMQAFLMKEVYLAGENAEQDKISQRIIRELFEAYVADANLLPQRYRKRIEADGLHRVACDYIAGMTDRFCKQQHSQICG